MSAFELMMKTNLSKLTPCGGCCDNCNHYTNGDCKGCIETGGKCIHMWQDSSGVCKVFKCNQEHGVPFCGLCSDFPCAWLKNWFDGWNKDGIEQMKKLKEKYIELHQN